MDIERHDGTKERRKYDSIDAMMKDAEKVVRDPSTKKIILWPKLQIPGKKRHNK
jgi:hypothetical protein